MDKIKVCLQTITNPEDAKSGELLDALKTLDSILSENTMNLNPQLKHFLEKRSYQKALIWSVDLFFTLAEIAMNRGVLPMSGSWCLRNALKKLAVSSEVQSSRCLFPVEAGADAAPLPLEDTVSD